jgi:hypothetical protein
MSQEEGVSRKNALFSFIVICPQPRQAWSMMAILQKRNWGLEITTSMNPWWHYSAGSEG